MLAVICLVALGVGNPMSGCLCDLMPPQTACGDHDHRAGHNSVDSHDSSDTGCDDSTCHCASCHSCHHMVIALSTQCAVALQVTRPARPAEPLPVDVHWTNGIFTPPKLV